MEWEKDNKSGVGNYEQYCILILKITPWKSYAQENPQPSADIKTICEVRK